MSSLPHGAAGPPGSEWARLHPLTPVLKGWRVLGVAAAIVAQDGIRRGGFSTLQVTIVLAVVVPVGAGSGYLSWRRRQWRVEGSDLRLDYGIFTRKSRRVPLARLQAIDVVRPLLARALGLAELRLEVAGHGSSHAILAYLTEPHALQVRAYLLDLAHRPAAAEGPAPPLASSVARGVANAVTDPVTAPPDAEASGWGPNDEAVLVTVPSGRFVASLLMSSSGAIGFAFVASVLLVAFITPAAAGAVAVALLPIGAAIYRRFTIEFGFTVALSPQGVRLTHGLLDTRHQTVPRGRVQAVRIVEPWLWRRRGWVRVEVDVAGYRSGGAAGAEERAASGVLLPVALRAEADRVIQTVLPGLVFEALPLTPAPRRARIRAPLSWHHLGGALDGGWSATSYGRIRKVTDVVPHDKLQSVRLVHGPLQRRLRLASVHLDTAGRNVRAAFRHWDRAAAAELTDTLARLARAARSHQQ